MPTQPALQASRPVKRSFTIAGHRTSISLEAAFWDVLKQAAQHESISLAELVRRIDGERGPAGLSGAVRVWVLNYAMRMSSSASTITAPAGCPPASAVAAAPSRS